MAKPPKRAATRDKAVTAAPLPAAPVPLLPLAGATPPVGLIVASAAYDEALYTSRESVRSSCHVAQKPSRGRSSFRVRSSVGKDLVNDVDDTVGDCSKGA